MTTPHAVRPVLTRDRSNMPEEIRAEVAAWARLRAWQLRPDYDSDDLEQEAFLVWLRVVKTYPTMPKKDLRGVFFRAINNQVTDLRRRRGRAPAVESLTREEGEDDVEVASEHSEFTDVDWKLFQEDAPDWISELIFAAERIASKSLGRPRATDRNEVICALVGKDPRKNDLLASLMGHLGD